jgi:hypothetical protein
MSSSTGPPSPLSNLPSKAAQTAVAQAPPGLGHSHGQLNYKLELIMETKTARIRALNDELLQHLFGGIAVMTPGVAALGQVAIDRIVKTIAVYDDFCHANDAHEEHDFGSFEAEGQKILFKIDYFDKTLKYHSPDPSDPSVTERIITIMLADEY